VQIKVQIFKTYQSVREKETFRCSLGPQCGTYFAEMIQIYEIRTGVIQESRTLLAILMILRKKVKLYDGVVMGRI
jgi:hypothetical protein